MERIPSPGNSCLHSISINRLFSVSRERICRLPRRRRRRRRQTAPGRLWLRLRVRLRRGRGGQAPCRGRGVLLHVELRRRVPRQYAAAAAAAAAGGRGGRGHGGGGLATAAAIRLPSHLGAVKKEGKRRNIKPSRILFVLSYYVTSSFSPILNSGSRNGTTLKIWCRVGIRFFRTYHFFTPRCFSLIESSGGGLSFIRTVLGKTPLQ